VRLALRSLALVVYAFSVHAEAADPARELPRVVEIEVDGTPAAVERLRATATEVLGRLGVSARVQAKGVPLTPESPALARAYVDLEVPSSPRLVVVDSESQRELARRTLSSGPSLETSVESVVLVLYLLIEAKLEQQATAAVEEPEPGATAAGSAVAKEPGRERTAAADRLRREQRRSPTRSPRSAKDRERAASPPNDSNGGDQSRLLSPPRTTSGVGFDAGPLFRVGTLDGDSALAGAGIALEVRAKRMTPRPGALFFAVAHLPTELAFGKARADLDLTSLRLLPTLGFDLAPSLSSTFAVGAGIDWLRAAPQSDTPARGQSVSLADFTLSALAGLRWVVAHPLVATAAASFDLDWSPRTFSARLGEQRTVLLELDRFRPSLLLGLALSSGER
jgi:hypothetical protein